MCRCSGRAATLQLPTLQAWVRLQLATQAVRRLPLSGARLLTAPAARTGEALTQACSAACSVLPSLCPAVRPSHRTASKQQRGPAHKIRQLDNS